MSVQFIIGGSGSGKTEYLYTFLTREAEAHPTKNYLVLVPEQFTLQTQRKLVQLSSHKAIMNIDVLSFERLAYRVFDDLGMENLQILEETGKNLALRRVAEEQKDRLSVVRPNLGRMGYISELKSMLSELMQYRVSCGELEEFIREHTKEQIGISEDSAFAKPAAGKTLPPALAAKLSDVAVLYQAFSDFLKERYLTAEELLPTLAGVAEKSDLLRDAVIAFDEYTGFTPAQQELIARLMKIGNRLIFTLTMDAREDFWRCRGEHELFAMPKETLRLISESARRQKVEILEPVVLSGAREKRYGQAPALAFLEEHLFRQGGAIAYNKIANVNECDTASGEIKADAATAEANANSPQETNRGENIVTQGIEISSYRNPREELVAVAREICRLVREEHLRYQEIAVVSGDAATYSRYVPEVFERYQIPYFLDATKEVLFHPFIELIRASVELVRRDFSYETVFRFLRCGFLPVEENQLDRLDNYVLAVGIRGHAAWNRRWLRMARHMETAELEEMEALRVQIMEVLEPFYQVMHKSSSTVEERLFALYELLTRLEVERQLSERGQQYLEQGEQSKAMEYEQIYQIVLELFDRFAGIMGQEEQSLQEFAEILDAGLDAARVASLPPGYDSVTVGDIERTRLNDISVLFFLGVNDGVIPAAESAGGILSRYERDRLRRVELPLAPGAREKTFIQRYYLYLNMTKPSRRLYVSYVHVDADGKALRPSYLIGVLERMFPELPVTDHPCIFAEPNLMTEASTMDYFLYGERDEQWAAAANYLLEKADEPVRERVGELLTAGNVHYEPVPISDELACALYGENLSGSVTRLEQFESCAYAHFLKYGLLLRERETSGFAGVDIGNLYHDALARYSVKLQESDYDWFSVPDAQRQALAAEAFTAAVDAYTNPSVTDTAASRHMLERMEHIFGETVWALTDQVRRGSFVPSEFEVGFYSYEVEDTAAQRVQDTDDSVYDESGRMADEAEAGVEEQSERKPEEAVFRKAGAEGTALAGRISLRGRIDRIDLYDAEGRTYIKVVDYKSGMQKFDPGKIYQGTQLQLILYLNAGLDFVQRRTHRPAAPGGVLYYHIDEPIIDETGDMTEDEAREALLAKLRPDGLVNRDEAVYRAMDADFETQSLAIPVTLNKSGSISARGSHVADESEFYVLSDYVDLKIAEAGAEILHGNIAVNPIRDGERGSCSYCPYAAVCGMDPKIPGYGYRHTPKADSAEILERMETEVALHKHS